MFAEQFNGNIIPLVEITNYNFKKILARDESGKILMEPDVDSSKPNKMRQVIESRENVTFQKIQELSEKTDLFVQYFRFNPEVYDDSMDKGVRDLAYLRMNFDVDDYLNETYKLTNISKNVIPVFIIKPDVVYSRDLVKLSKMVNRIKSKGRKVCVRIDVAIIREYKTHLLKILLSLDKNDYVIFDFQESLVSNRTVRDLKNNTNAITIALHSYKKRNVSNGSYDIGENITGFNLDYFNNYKKLGFDGFSDFICLQDSVPHKKLRAMYSTTFIYNIDLNKYVSFRSPQIESGVKGKRSKPNFKELRDIVLNSPMIISDRQYTDCPGVQLASDVKKWKNKENRYTYGYFNEWKKVTVMSHLYAMIKKMSSN